MGKIQTYLEEVVKEMRKVSWPKQSELIGNTIITIIASFAVAMIIYGLDRAIGSLMEFIYS